MKFGSRLLLLSACASVIFSNECFAATATGTFNVTATINNTCNVDTANTTNLSFGTYTGVLNNSTNVVAVQCNSGTTYNIALNFGLHSSGGTNRRMLNGVANFLTYQIYSDSGRTTVWGDGTNGQLNPTSGSFTATGISQSYTGYGQIAAGQFPASGTYNDTITITVTYT